MEKFVCVNIPVGSMTPKKLVENNPISFHKAYIAPVITPNSENLSFNFGLILHLCRKVDTKLIQNIYMKIKDPKYMQGISLYYNFSVPDNAPEIVSK
jgi:hypothetical protein